ncbi:MAG: hypothetical protein JWL90_4238, partial [Chthoniobacteraceae bacterium]|nr:hypothetical protein [Chthoniobacteraceae bacterium]
SANSAALEAEQHEWEAQMSRPISWTILKPLELSAVHATLAAAQADGLINATGNQESGKDVYTVKAPTTLRGITAIRLEALSDVSLPGNGPGRSTTGNAVVSELRVALEPKERSRARFLRIELPGNEQMLSLAEVQAMSKGANIAIRGKASQSSTDFGGNPERAIDGNTDGDYFKANSVTHTRKEQNPWWEVDLKEDAEIEEIVVWNRTDGGSGPRLVNFKVALLDAARQLIWDQSVAASPNPSASIAPTGGRSIALQNPSADFNQAGFEVSKAIDGDPKSGWAFLQETGKPHAAVFETAPPIAANSEGTSLIFTIRQDHGANHTLGRFRLSATNAPLPVRELPNSIRAILAIEPSERAPGQRSEIAAYFLPFSKQFAALKTQIDAKKTALAKIAPVALPIMKERAADQRRKSFILNKGNFLLHGEEVTAALPVAFTSAPKGEVNRLTLAQWLISRENPLTARVAVNRFWAQLFGTGIVESEEDFGTQGQLPSHPELLDWLAVTFMDSGWDIKALLKTIVTSATYRQSSKAPSEHLQIDARNRLLAHFPRRRLDAEGVRDQALMLSGLLSSRIGGPSVYPPQPAGLWQVAFNGGQNGYPTSTGEDRYRRGLYTFLRRTMPNPTMTTFDAPSREICVIRRVPTNTPLQAFVALNDPVFVECAQALGRRLLHEGGLDDVARLRFGLQLCLGRPADEKQVAALQLLLNDALVTYRADPDSALKLATMPLGPLPADINAVNAAAWTVVANVLLNLDAVLTKN